MTSPNPQSQQRTPPVFPCPKIRVSYIFFYLELSPPNPSLILNAKTSSLQPQTTSLTQTADEALISTLAEIREGSNCTLDYPGIARQRYHNALKILTCVTEKSALSYPPSPSSSAASSSSSSLDSLLFRKAHLQTLAELGLSQVQLPAAPHLTKAYAANDTAFALAGRASRAASPGLLARARLNKAHLKAREARVDEKRGKAPKSRVKELRYEAFEAYKRAAAEMRGWGGGGGKRMGTGMVMDDYEVLAQALLGCGRMSKKLGGGTAHRVGWSSIGSGGEKKMGGLGPPEGYFEEAYAAVREGKE
ncbi:MAG: hypothetical protein LQ340_005390, partial [Diploschistes diacapsis]